MLAARPSAHPRLTTAIQTLLLLSFVALAAQQWQYSGGRITATDHQFYMGAVSKAWAHSDPYLPHHIGMGYLYPPPALLLLKASTLFPASFSRTAVWIAWSVAAMCASLALLLGAPSWPRLTAALLLLSSSGVVATIQVGQINGLALFGIVAFYAAWQRQHRALACAALAFAICLKGTPVLLLLLLCTREGWQWALLVIGLVLATFAIAELVIPAPHLTASYVEAIRWASSPLTAASVPYPVLFNYSLSVTIPVLVLHVGTRSPQSIWHMVHWAKIVGLTLLLGPVYVAYLRSRCAARARDLLFVVCTVCVVLAPNLVWLHHTILLIPAFWFLIVESDRTPVWVLSLLALACFQCTRWAAAISATGPAYIFGVAQLLLLIAVVAYTASVGLSVQPNLRPAR